MSDSDNESEDQPRSMQFSSMSASLPGPGSLYLLPSSSPDPAPTLPQLTPPALPAERRAHRANPEAPRTNSSFHTVLRSVKKESKTAVLSMSARGELASPTGLTEEQLEEMEVDAPLLLAEVVAAKKRLSIKILAQEAHSARLNAARQVSNAHCSLSLSLARACISMCIAHLCCCALISSPLRPSRCRRRRAWRIFASRG